MSAEADRVPELSDWMSRLPAALHNIPLFQLAIPGSHDSMSYDLDMNSFIIEPAHLKKFSRVYGARKVIHKWATTQEESITRQLDAGVRYLDLRIVRKPDEKEPARFYFHHGLCTNTDVESVLRQIHDWAESHPKEILILALSHFEGFDQCVKEQLHFHLINLIKNIFGTKLFPRSETPTLQSCWDKGRNIIVSYDYQGNQQVELWGKIPYYYANTMDPAKVESELCRVLEKARPSQCFFVCGLNLTLPEDSTIFRYILWPRENFTKVIRRSLPELLQWLRQQTGRSPNIIASDVVTRDNFVATVVQLNYSEDKLS